MDSQVAKNSSFSGGYIDREAEIQAWVNPIVCPVHRQHPKIAIRAGKVGLVRPCCHIQKELVLKELRRHRRS